MKKTDLFDELMREKLNSIQPGGNPEHWELLNQRLDEGALEDELGYSVPDSKPVDEAIFEKLHQYSAPYNPSHWDKMAGLLDEVFAWPTQILRYKATELALMLLLFLFLWQFTFTTGVDPIYQDAPVADLSIEQEKQGKPVDSEASVMPSSRVEGIKKQQEASVEQPDLSAGTTEAQAATQTATAAEPNPLDSGPSAAIATSPASTGNESPVAKKARESLIVPKLPVQPAGQLSYTNTDLPRLAVEFSITAPEREAFSSFTPVETVAPGLLDKREKALPDELSAHPAKRKAVLRLGMFGSGEYNHILVQSSNEKSKSEQLDRFSIGYGSGLSVGVDMGRWELETGAIYAAREFPVGVIYIDGSIADGLFANELKAAELNILNVPLHFRYNFILKREWRVYALAGGALQMAFQANYFTVSSPELTYQPVNPGMPRPTPGRGQEPSVIRIKEESIGLLEGGAFNDNAYLTGNIGFGVERYINDSWSLYVQPTYQHSLYYFREGLGPNRDRINSLSIFMGAKVRLW